MDPFSKRWVHPDFMRTLTDEELTELEIAAAAEHWRRHGLNIETLSKLANERWEDA